MAWPFGGGRVLPRPPSRSRDPEGILRGSRWSWHTPEPCGKPSALRGSAFPSWKEQSGAALGAAACTQGRLAGLLNGDLILVLNAAALNRHRYETEAQWGCYRVVITWLS